MAHRMERRINEPLIAVQGSEESIVDRVLFQWKVGLRSELDDLQSLSFESLLYLSDSQFPPRKKSFDRLSFSKARRKNGFEPFRLALSFVIPSWVRR
jgi:hypothetical protein